MTTKVPYKLFISKLRAYGLSINACNYIMNYYINRQQCVKLGKNRSEWLFVNKGSAQGSLMGPISYNMFANDMMFMLDNDIDIYNYADDNSLLCAGSGSENVKHKLLHNVNKVVECFQGNHMKVNPDKFQCIVFGKQDNLGQFNIGDHKILPEDNVKILGLNVDNKLNFNTQITNICQTAGRKVQVLSRLSHVLDQSSKMLLYNSFIECYFNYCSVIWHFTSNRNTYKIEKIQKKALRYITRDFSSSYSKLLNVCNKNSLYIVRTRKIFETE